MKFLFAAIILFISAQLGAQTHQDAKHFSGWLYMENNTPKKYKAAENNTRLEEVVFSKIFLFYKKYISSQDRNSCTFSPSCSEYALQSIKEEGLLLGMMSGFDRISRCHNLSRERYRIQPHTHLLYDPVE